MASYNSYNSVGELLASVSTDAGISNYLYSTDGKLKFSQNALEEHASSDPRQKKFTYAHYDKLGRVTETGQVEPNLTEEYFLDQYSYVHGLFTATPINPLVDKIDDQDFTFATIKEPNSIFYDIADPSFYTETGLPTTYKQNFLLGRVSYSLAQSERKTVNDDYNISKTWYSYDDQGRVVWTAQKFYNMDGEGYDKVKTIFYSYDIIGNLLQTIYQKDVPAEKFYHYYYYDADKRLKIVNTSFDGVHLEKQAEYSYYLHGPLKRTELGNRLQAVDYVYTGNGWLKSMNCATLDNIRDPGKDGTPFNFNASAKDLFGMALDYFSGDYLRLNTFVQHSEGSTSYPDLYNGIIRSQRWKSRINSGGLFQYNNNENLVYNYAYDNQYQLTSAKFGTVNEGGLNNATGLNASTDFIEENLGEDYEVKVSYYGNGNIHNLNRNAYGSDRYKDVLTYNYFTGTNKLEQVFDNSTATQSLPGFEVNNTSIKKYFYDEIGEVYSDEGNQNYIVYNSSGLAKEIYSDISMATLKASFLYDESGRRIRKISGTGFGDKETWYVYDVSGNLISTYDRPRTATDPAELKELNYYGLNRIGLLKKVDNDNKSIYELSDHLGNVRARFQKSKVLAVSTNYNNDSQYDYLFPDNGTFDYSRNASGTGASVKTLYPTSQYGAGIRDVEVHPGDEVHVTYSYFNDAGYIPLAMIVFELLDYRKIQLPNNWDANPITQSSTSWISDGYTYLVSAALPPGTYYLKIYPWNIEGKDGIQDPYPIWFDNISVTITPAGTNVSGIDVPESIGMADYYPHGSIMPGRSWNAEADKYRFNYQGQFAEKDDETSYNNFELRDYDGLIGRWLNRDPYNQYHSPYIGMGNNPINFIDPSGGWGGFWDNIANFFRHKAGQGKLPTVPKAGNSQIFYAGFIISDVWQGLTVPNKNEIERRKYNVGNDSYSGFQNLNDWLQNKSNGNSYQIEIKYSHVSAKGTDNKVAGGTTEYDLTIQDNLYQIGPLGPGGKISPRGITQGINTNFHFKNFNLKNPKPALAQLNDEIGNAIIREPNENNHVDGCRQLRIHFKVKLIVFK
jgi:RHS repeat-associated protein